MPSLKKAADSPKKRCPSLLRSGTLIFGRVSAPGNAGRFASPWTSTPSHAPDWAPVPHEGCRGVESKLLLTQHSLALVMMRFAENATIHEHPAGWPIDVMCLEGWGNVSVGDETLAISAGQRVCMPPDVPHRIWTNDSTMIALVAEHLPR